MLDLRLEKIEDIFAVADDFYDSLAPNGDILWWRGHADSRWQLVPSVHRARFRLHERFLSQDFLRRARTRYADCPRENEWPDWLILMQHHGLPTRLLDWSESFLVATYFAVSEGGDSDGAVWALNPCSFNYYQNNSERIIDAYEDIIANLFSGPFKPVASIEEIVAVQMPENHLRMLIQRASFTVHGIRTPIEKLGTGRYLGRLRIPAKLKRGIKVKLARLGYTVSNLFPDLDHLAQDLRTRHCCPSLEEKEGKNRVTIENTRRRKSRTEPHSSQRQQRIK